MDGLTLGFLRALARHPWLVVEAVLMAIASAGPGWPTRMPFLPRPEPSYLQWRLITAYGRADHPLSPTELVEFLRWRRALRRT